MTDSRATLGFTLIEIVIGIVVFSIAITIVTSVLSPLTTRSVDPLVQVRATELAQGLLEEISAKSFDEQSTKVLGSARCGETGLGAAACTTIPSCTTPGTATAATEETDREDYDDVDDYHCLSQSGSNILAGDGDPLSIYQGFQVAVLVGYDQGMDGTTASSPENAKLVTVTVTAPNQQTFAFSSYRFNY
ncbi:prepilin-type cleavage/methylation domain-containing protein [Saccharobesus litoralis]|uniref:Prepilin-type cleavage/methylation domain-containing protein n=1 Tax=Saccharobesus litoralis TaxID=2172099 RepID=A0A2S0VXG8_9ALTE|nr:type II secretion system protein [Saccharobesus litoralis]AWB68810.1 prepilin-type cleavage/methylation domain-containing protein [Saccharobesus litoralis]